MKKIAVFGAGGLGREIPCIINKINEIETLWDFIGFFDDGIEIGTEVDGHLILGGLSELNAWSEELSIVFGIASPKIVKKIVGDITNKLIDFPNIISPDFYFDLHSVTQSSLSTTKELARMHILSFLK